MATVDELKFPDTSISARSARRPERASRFAQWIKSVNPAYWKYVLVAADMLTILLAFVGAYYIRYELQWFRAVDPVSQVGFEAYIPFAVALLFILPISFRFSGVYPYRRGRSFIEETYAIATATAMGVMVMIIAILLFRPLLYSRLIFFYMAALVTILLGGGRFILQLVLDYLRTHSVGVRRMILVGAGDVGRMVMRTVVARPDYGYQLIGFLDDNPTKGFTNIGPYRALGPVDNLGQVLMTDEVDTVIICLPWQSHRMIQRLLRTCEQHNIRAQVVPDLFQLTKNQVYVEELNGIPLISTRDISIQGWNLVIKRAFDLVLSTVGGLISLPICLLVAIAIKLDSPGPILFSQTRIGRNGQPFQCYKFRSMVEGAAEMLPELDELNEASGPLFKVRNDPRRTRVGRFIRHFSLDELPQIINVIRGEMSWIGPRPNLPEEVAQYQEWHKKRLTVSPGITGLWQVSGRSDLTFDEMVLLDIYYVENWNLAMDLGILVRSIPAIVGARGAY